MEASTVFVGHKKSFEGIIGFDLGTTNSVVSSYSSSGIPIPLDTGEGVIVPSCVQFNGDGSVVVGVQAYKNRGESNVLYSFKKYMGTDTPLSVQVGTDTKTFTAREISQLFVEGVMKKILSHNPEYVGVKNVVVSVPAYFDVPQIKDTVEAFEQLCYKVIHVQQEPTSAGLVFQQLKRIKGHILVFDLGGGTFDAVLMQNQLGFPSDSVDVYKTAGFSLPKTEDVLRIVDISGDNFLGGDDIDKYACELFNEKHKLSIPLRKLLPVAEEVKKTSSQGIFELDGSSYTFDVDLVHKATEKVLSRCMEIVDSMLRASGITNPHCVLCGGSTKSLLIRDALSKRFSLSYEIDPDLAVSVGNAMTAKLISNKEEISVISVLPKHIGTIVEDRFTPIVWKGNVIPARKTLWVQNSQPFEKSLSVIFYQSDDLFGEPTPIATVTIPELTGFNADGFAAMALEVVVRLDNVIDVSVTNEGAKIGATLDFTNITSVIPEENKHVRRFREAIDSLGATHLLEKLVIFAETGDKGIANEINKELSSLRKR